MKHILMYHQGSEFTFGVSTINLKSTNMKDAKLESVLFLERCGVLEEDVDIRNIVIYQISDELFMDNEFDEKRKEKIIAENQLKSKELKKKIYNKFKNR